MNKKINKESIKFYEYSKDFFNIASFCPKLDPFIKFSPTSYYLYCHSIELSLKTFLLFNKNKNLKTIKELKHNLENIIETLENKKILNQKEKNIIKLANSYYNSKGFEYYCPTKEKILLTETWNLDDLHLIAKKLLNKLEKTIKE